MADITWSTPHTGSSESISNVEVLWLTEFVFVVCWEDAAGTGFKANVYSSNGAHLHSQSLFTYGGIRDQIQLAKVRDNHWVLSFTEAVGLEAVRMHHLEWTGSSITNHGQITALANEQTRLSAICNVGEDKIMLWGRRFDLADVLYSKYCTYNGSTWSVGSDSSISPSHYADALRAYMVAANKGILFWNKDPGNDSRCHGFSMTSGGGTDVVSIDGDLPITHFQACRLADNRIIVCTRVNDGGLVGRVYAITLEEAVPFQLRPTVGTGFEFYSGNCTNNYCTRRDETHFLIAYEDRDDSQKGKTRLCTVDWSTRTITANDVEIFSENVIGDGAISYGIGMDSNSDGIVALSYRDEDDNNYVKTMVSGIPVRYTGSQNVPIGRRDKDYSSKITKDVDYKSKITTEPVWELEGDVAKGTGRAVFNLLDDNAQKGLIRDANGKLIALPGDLVKDSGLESAVLISLFTDKRASLDDTLPDEESSRRGWWGDQALPVIEDDEIGSHLWLLERSKTTDVVLVQAKQYAKDALQWMIDDDIVSKIEVDVERNHNLPNDGLFFHVKLYKTYKNKATLMFEGNWGLQII